MTSPRRICTTSRSSRRGPSCSTASLFAAVAATREQDARHAATLAKAGLCRGGTADDIAAARKAGGRLVTELPAGARRVPRRRFDREPAPAEGLHGDRRAGAFTSKARSRSPSLARTITAAGLDPASERGPAYVVAAVLGVGSHAVTVEVRRMGGGFGGKETQANHFRLRRRACARSSGARPGFRWARPRRRHGDHRKNATTSSATTRSASTTKAASMRSTRSMR